MVRAIGSTPDDPHSLIYLTLISAISKSESHVYLTNAYFVPDPQLLDALTNAARRGVDVRLVLPGKSDASIPFHAGRSHYSTLLRAGVKIYERRGAMLHAKTATIDGVWSCVGSTNLDWRSFLHNDELDATILGREFAGQCRPPLPPTSRRRKPSTWRAGRRGPSLSGSRSGPRRRGGVLALDAAMAATAQSDRRDTRQCKGEQLAEAATSKTACASRSYVCEGRRRARRLGTWPVGKRRRYACADRCAARKRGSHAPGLPFRYTPCCYRRPRTTSSPAHAYTSLALACPLRNVCPCVFHDTVTRARRRRTNKPGRSSDSLIFASVAEGCVAKPATAIDTVMRDSHRIGRLRKRLRAWPCRFLPISTKRSSARTLYVRHAAQSPAQSHDGFFLGVAVHGSLRAARESPPDSRIAAIIPSARAAYSSGS